MSDFERKVEERLLWLGSFVCMSNCRDPAAFVDARTRLITGFDATARLHAHGTILAGERCHILAGFANRARAADSVLSRAWQLLALRTGDAAAVIHAAVAGTAGLLPIAAAKARARLHVWDAVPLAGFEDAPAHDGDFFQIAEMKWRREMPRIVK